METKHVSIEEATIDQLRWFAEVILQLELNEKSNSNHVRAAIVRAGWPADKPIFTNQKADHYPDNCDDEGNPRPRVREMEFNGKMRQCIRIMIPIQEKAGGEEPVPVGVNGTVMWIPRAEPVFVPVEYVECLEHAEKFVYEPFSDMPGDMGGLKPPKIVKEYPFQYVA